ncbi:CDPK-related kinase 3 isoform X2 [Populus trichocarpa]|uniref:CDPK-related kinase 3 isoform X2 n=1 Tax=Populus trichocarpa TaxID=3694 RepID=UPI002278769C|nr:CDPK-related kinase 3 isoform X2 [Populus trichocarpa]
MGQCYGKTNSTNINDATTVTIVASSTDQNQQTPLPSSTPRNGVRSLKYSASSSSTHPSPWPSPYPQGVAASPLQGVSPSPARSSTPRRFFKRPFPPPSPARHIAASLVKRLGGRGKPKEGPIPEHGSVEAEQQQEQSLDKSFGYSKNFGAKYELGKEIGRGHFGHTCSARVKKGELKDEAVAVKIISKAKMTSTISIEDVRREVKILKALSGHRHLVKFYDAFEDANNVYIVMELCEGGELLDRILARGGRYTEEDAKAIIVQILCVVAFCHLQGVVHRDLKPENFLFTSGSEDADMKLIDFGLSDFFRPVLRSDPNFEDLPWPSVTPEAKDFVKRLLNKDYRKRMTAVQALTHPWLRDDSRPIHVDILIYKLVKVYLHATPFKRAALKALSKALTEDELFYLRAQFNLLGPNGDGSVSLDNFRMALVHNATDAMRESRVPEILNAMESLSYRKMYFEEFCAAAISTYQLEALEGWEQIASTAFEHFEQEGNRVISVEELARELNVGPSAYTIIKDWIRSSDGKLSVLGYAKFLHGVTLRSTNTRHR